VPGLPWRIVKASARIPEFHWLPLFLHDQWLSDGCGSLPLAVAPGICTQVAIQLPGGLTIHDVQSISLEGPSLQAQVHFAEYRVEVETAMNTEDLVAAIRSLLAATELPWQHQRDTGVHHYYRRPLVDEVWLIGLQDTWCTLGMRLLCSSSGAGRPEQVTKAMGLPQRPRAIHRTRLILR
jgi:hypothetical protein